MWTWITIAFCIAAISAVVDQWCEYLRADVMSRFNARKLSRYSADLKLEMLEKIQEHLPMVGWVGVTVAAIGCVFVIIRG